MLAFFFPYEQLPIAILWIITLKLALMGTTMFSYLKYTYQKVDGTTLLFQRPIVSVALSPSIAKTLCGWMH